MTDLAAQHSARSAVAYALRSMGMLKDFDQCLCITVWPSGGELRTVIEGQLHMQVHRDHHHLSDDKKWCPA